MSERCRRWNISRTWGLKDFLQLLTNHVNALFLPHLIKVFTACVWQLLPPSQRDSSPPCHVKLIWHSNHLIIKCENLSFEHLCLLSKNHTKNPTLYRLFLVIMLLLCFPCLSSCFHQFMLGFGTACVLLSCVSFPFLVQAVMVVIIRVFLMHLQSIRHHLIGYLRSSVTALGCRIIVSFSSGNRPTIFYVLLWLAGHSWITFGFLAVCDAHCPAILSLKFSGHQNDYLSILPQFAHLHYHRSTWSPLKSPALCIPPRS